MDENTKSGTEILPSRTFRKSDTTITCKKEEGGCGAWLVLSPFAARVLGAEVIPGFSLYALILTAHVASGHKIGTEADALAHNCKVTL